MARRSGCYRRNGGQRALERAEGATAFEDSGPESIVCLNSTWPRRFQYGLRVSCHRDPRSWPRCRARAGAIMKCVNGDDLAVGPNDGTGIADVLAATVAAEDERISPRFALVGAEPGVDRERWAAVAVGQAKPAVGQPHQARRVSLADVGRRRREIRPRPAVVVRYVGVDPPAGKVAAGGRSSPGRSPRRAPSTA